MTQLLSPEFLMAVLFIVNGFLVILLWVIIRRVNRLNLNRPQPPETDVQGSQAMKTASESAREVLDLLDPLVKASREAAFEFDEQIREKRALSKQLNDALDARIISINLLLSRAKTLHEKLEKQQNKIVEQSAFPPFHSAPSSGTQIRIPPRSTVLDQQNQILDLYYQKKDIDTIARMLSLPKEEVRLVVSLKEKFVAMEQGR